MTAAAPAARSPRRFRRKLLAVLLAAGLAPLIAWGVVSRSILDRFLGISLASLAGVLERAEAAIERSPSGDSAVAAEVRRAQLNVAQAELARRSLARLAPRAFLAILLASALLTALAALMLGRALATPIDRLTTGMLRFASGDLTHQISEPKSRRRLDELGFLVHQFNRMGGELVAQRERLQVTEELAAWREVARALAHELANPLTAMKMAMAGLGRIADRPLGIEEQAQARLRESIALVDAQIDVLMRMTRSFSTFAKLPAPMIRPVDLGALLDEVCALYRNQSPVALEYARGPAIDIEADADQLKRAFGNLIKNALEASQPGDEPVRVELLRPAPEVVAVMIQDSGKGIPRRLEGRELLRSLGSTKPSGSGIGLPVSQKIIHDHGGTLTLSPREGRGTRATVTLPLRSPQAKTA